MKIIKWEYYSTLLDAKTPTSLLMEHLTRKGSEGWELVYIRPPENLGNDPSTKTPFRFIFKRPCGYIGDGIE